MPVIPYFNKKIPSMFKTCLCQPLKKTTVFNLHLLCSAVLHRFFSKSFLLLLMSPLFIRPIRSRRCSLRCPLTWWCRTCSWPALWRSPLTTSWRDASRCLSQHRSVSWGLKNNISFIMFYYFIITLASQQLSQCFLALCFMLIIFLWFSTIGQYFVCVLSSGHRAWSHTDEPCSRRAGRAQWSSWARRQWPRQHRGERRSLL